MDLSEYALDRVRADTDFVLSRGTGKNPTASRAPSILALASVAEHPEQELVRRLEHEYALSAELDRAWAVRPILLTRKDDRTTLVLEDPGGQPLDLLAKPADLGQFLRTAVGVWAALRQLHGRGPRPQGHQAGNILVNAEERSEQRASRRAWRSAEGGSRGLQERRPSFRCLLRRSSTGSRL
jgi:hypothetical protein